MRNDFLHLCIWISIHEVIFVYSLTISGRSSLHDQGIVTSIDPLVWEKWVVLLCSFKSIYLFVFFFLIYFSPTDMGLLDPATSDGRVIFFLPWEGKTAKVLS